MIDFKQELKSYSPIDLDRLLESNLDMPDNLKNSVLLYNKALANIRIKSEDIAIIELKKAISLNPDFCEAINLLGLLYISIGERNKARDCFEKALSNDPNDKKAIEYIKVLDPNYFNSENVKDKHKAKKQKKKVPVAGNNKKAQHSTSRTDKSQIPILGLMKTDVAKYIVGFLAGILVFFLITMIAKSQEPVLDVPNASEDIQINQSDEYEKKYNELLLENKALVEQLEVLNKTAQSYTSLSKLLEIDKQVSEGNYVVAADMIVEFKEAELNDKEIEKYNSLRSRTMEKAAQERYNQGRELYKKKQFDEALEHFDKLITYVDEWKNLNATIYYIGVCHQELNNNEKAIEAFNRVINEYPSSSFAGYSKTRVMKAKYFL
jgi:tetratricopeptide (TPR) repeat protein